MSCAKARLSSSSTMALPPYLTTTTRARGSARATAAPRRGSAALAEAARQGGLVAPVAKAGHVQYALFSWT